MRTLRGRRLPGRIGAADLALFRTVAGTNTPLLDRVLPSLSQAANHSRLWTGAALLLAGAAGRRGRRAALRGMVSVAVSSALVNLPAKLAWRRTRPPIDLVPHVRRVRRLPTSSSFPSGHSASAAAFATGVALELPPAGVPVGLLAAGVAFSRVYTGVHYPADVVAGSAVGVAIGFASTRWWPLAPGLDEAPPRHPHAAEAAAVPDGAGVVCCVNTGAGAAWTPGRGPGAHVELLRGPEAVVREHLPRAEVVTCTGGELRGALEDGARRAVVLGVAGGDGSANAAAEVAHRHGLPLLLVPTGTHNHLARDLGLSVPSDGLRAAQRGEAVLVDLATIAGKPFLNAAGLGGYAAVVAARERLEDRIGKWPALLWGLLRVLRGGRPTAVEIDGRPRTVWILFAGNCRYRPHGFAPAWRDRLDDGLLDVRIVDAAVPWARTRLVLSMLTGRLGRSRAYEEWTAASVHVRSPGGPLALVRDGELFDGPEEFEIRKEPDPVAVFAPC